MYTPDEAFVEEVLAHGRKQLEKGWTPLSTAGNLCARYGLTEDCGKRIVGVMMAGRVGPTVEHLAGELTTALELSMEEATARVMEVRTGLVDPDNWATMHLEFDPDRAPSYIPATDEAPPPSPPKQPTSSPPASGPRGPIRLEINLRRADDEKKKKKGGLFGRGD